ncbi:hypothetical protein H0H87_010068 [Tephrocybe sp. NHM501043]|nr:hypothetical protein H0H87_010068 [Tephrocybe sp. NHM501043]
MSAAILTDESSTGLCDYDAAATLLSRLCPDFIKDNPDIDLGSPESFACLLYRDPDLFEYVKKAGSLRKLDIIWTLCTELALPETLVWPPDPNTVPPLLDRIGPKMLDLVAEKGQKLVWTLDPSYPDTAPDIRRFDFQSLLEEESVPSMLFYELGGFQYVPNLINASATGKTRLLYEGLCQHWGLYLTAHADAGEARALQATLGPRLYYERDVVKYLPRKSALGFSAVLAKNREIAHRRFSAVLLVHLLIFREFLMAVHSQDETVIEDQKRRWLLVQLHSQLLVDSSDDTHEVLFRAVEREPPRFIEEQITKVLDAIHPLLPQSIKSDGFFIAIDEANYAVRALWYSDDEDTEVYPPLEDIIRIWTQRLSSKDIPVTFVVAGTEIPQRYFPASSPEWSSWRWTSDTGSFDDSEIQKRYILPFLPAGYSETPHGLALLNRARDWCRPRHDKLQHPHGVLDQYIKGLTEYDALDSKEYVVEEGPCTTMPFFSRLGRLAEEHPLVRSTTHEVIMHYIITGQHPPCFDISKVDIVTSAVGEFKDTNMEVISLDQPGPTIAVAIWLSKTIYSQDNPRSLTSFDIFCDYFGNHWPNGDTYASASYLALYFAHVYKDQGDSTTSEIFSVLDDPGWLLVGDPQPTQLVILQKNEDNMVKEMVIGASALQPDAPPLGYRASNAEDVLAWLRHERSGAFCICPPDCEAELIFVLRRRGKYMWIMLRLVGRGSRTPVHADELHPELDKLLVGNVFSASEVSLPEGDKSLSRRLTDAFMDLPNPLAPAGELSMLRVVANFSQQSVLESKKFEESPVAVLNNSTFQDVTESIPGQDLIQTLVKSMHGKRASRYPDNLFKKVNPRTTPRKRKSADIDVPTVSERRRPPSRAAKTKALKAVGESPQAERTASSVPQKRSKKKA